MGCSAGVSLRCVGRNAKRLRNGLSRSWEPGRLRKPYVPIPRHYLPVITGQIEGLLGGVVVSFGVILILSAAGAGPAVGQSSRQDVPALLRQLTPKKAEPGAWAQDRMGWAKPAAGQACRASAFRRCGWRMGRRE
jgi:hypothetical protein